MQQLALASDRAADWKAAAFRSARLAWEIAPRRCPEASINCAAYHRAWPILRLLGLAAEPDDQRAFLLPALRDALVRLGPRVLVSGSADAAMAAMVVEAGIEARRRPRITVLDQCATPLAVNGAFMQAAGTAIATVRTDVLAYKATDLFDLVVTHSLFGYIAPARWPALMSKWAEVLRPGGRAITVVRLRPLGEARSFAADAGERLAIEVRRRAAPHRQEIGLALDELAAAAVEYAKQRPRSFPLRSLDGLVELFEDANFRLLHAEVRESAARITGIEGPGLPRAGVYAEVVAEKR